MLAKFIEGNLLQGFREGSFTEAQVAIFSLNYVAQGRITDEAVVRIQESVVTIKAELEEEARLEEERLEAERLEQEKLEQELQEQLEQEESLEVIPPEEEQPGGD